MTRFLGSAGKYCSRKHIDLRLKTVLPSRTSSITLTGREECVEYNGAGPAVAICLRGRLRYHLIVDASVISFASETMFPSNVFARMCDLPYPNGIGIFHL